MIDPLATGVWAQLLTRRAKTAVALAAAVWLLGPAAGSELSDSVERGRRIFHEGASDSGAPIMALVSRGGTAIPGSVLPCVGCHGSDGEGRPEGGVVPPAITWKSLSAPNGHEHTYGRRHRPFDAATLAAAITSGVDPDGNGLDSAMPRYEISDADMADLIAYLKELEHDLDPGLTDDAIRIATLLPGAELGGGAGVVMRQVLEGMFAEINKHGGIHGRQIELVVAEYTDDAVRNVWRVREVLERESIFALVGSYSIGIEAELAEIAEEFEVPAVGPFTQLPRTGDNGERHTFYLTGGLVEQAAVLARSLVGRTDEALTSVAVVHPAGRIYEHAVETVQGVLARYGAPAAVEVPYTPPDFDVTAIADALLSTGSQAVLVLTSAKELNLLGTELQKRSAAPDLLLPGLFASADMFALGDAYGGRLLVGYPSIPADHTPAGVREFETLHADYAFGYEHSAAQISAFVAAKVLAEGLKRAGRGLSREKLMDALEGLSEFRPGLMPALSYGRRNRIGANGGYVLEADLGQQKFVGAGDWISLRN